MTTERPDNDAAGSAEERSDGTEQGAPGADAPGDAQAVPDAPDHDAPAGPGAPDHDAPADPGAPDHDEQDGGASAPEQADVEGGRAEAEQAGSGRGVVEQADVERGVGGQGDDAERGQARQDDAEGAEAEQDDAERAEAGQGDAERGVGGQGDVERGVGGQGDRDAGAAPSEPGPSESAEVPGPHEVEAGPSARRRSPVLIASVAAAVLLVGGGGAYLATGASGGSGSGAGSGASGDGTTPPPLALDGYSEGGSNGIAPGEPNPYGVTYKVDGTLPDGPGSAPVYRAAGEVGKGEVARLAKALGLTGAPVVRGQSWQVGPDKDGFGPSLVVNRQAPGTWTFRRYAAGTDACQSMTACTKDPANPADDPVSEAAAKKAAAPVLKAVGQDDAKVDAGQVMGAQRAVNADPLVGGLPTYGWSTGLTVSAQGEVVGGTGQLKPPVKGDTYPVLGARKTLELMNSAPTTDHRMGIGGCASPVPLKDRLEQPCGQSRQSTPSTSPRQTVTVEDAVFGLAARPVGGRQALVPSWLFQVKGAAAPNGFTVTYPAVDPKYLASNATTPTPSATEPGDEPTSAPATRDVKADGYTAEGDELTVSFTGGVCADYEATASESAHEVTVKVTEKPWKGKVCIMIAKEIRKTVQLDAPVGDREVVGSDGKQIPLLKQGARLPRTTAVQ